MRCHRTLDVDNPLMNEPWIPHRSETELRKSRARTLYDFEVECRKQGWGDPAFIYDEE